MKLLVGGGNKIYIMISRSDIVKCSVTNFTKFGSKRYTLDDLTRTLGISKKTIYKYFTSKEALVTESVMFLINKFNSQIAIILAQNHDPIVSIILIYKMGFDELSYFRPSFIFGLKKYYPSANDVFDEFRNVVVNETIYTLLEKAKGDGIINSQVNSKLFCDLYFYRFEELALKNNTFIEKYSNKELLDHFIIYNLKGITVSTYSNTFFE